MPCPQVGGVHHHRVSELLQHRVWEHSALVIQKEALTLHLSQRQHHRWVFWGNIQHLGRSREPIVVHPHQRKKELKP